MKFNYDWSSGVIEEHVDGGRRTPKHGYTISSPCEPEGSGELKNFF